jgi:hypothetical protein
MPRQDDSANGRPNAQARPDRSSNAQATPEHAQARDGVLTAQARRLTARRLEHALADPARKPSTLEACPGVTYRARGVTATLARLVRDAIEDGYLDGYGVTDATAVTPWVTSHLTADLAREVRRRRLGRDLTLEEADREALRPLRSKVGATLTYLAHATGAYAYRPGDGRRPARLAYAPCVLEEVTPLARGSRGGGHPPEGEGGVTPRRVTRTRSLSVEKSPRTRSSERERRPAQAPTVTTSTSTAPTTEARRTVTSTVLEAWADAITRNLDGLKALRLLDAEGWREDADLRRALAAIATRANGHDPARVIGRLDLKGTRNLEGDGWRAPTLTARLASLLAGNAGRDAIAAVAAADRERARLEAEAVEREEAALAATATATPMPEWLRASRGRLTAAPVTPDAAPVLEHAQAPACSSDDPRAVLEDAARTRRLSDDELAALERLTLDAIAAGLTAERTPAYLLDPPHRDRVLEHAVAPSPVLERAQALAAFAHLLDARRRHATPPPGDAVLAVLEQRLGRLLTLSELDLLDALPVTITADLDALDAWADDGLALTASTGRP